MTRLVESRCGAVALGRNISVAAPFVWRCLNSSTMAPFPHPAHRTGHADLPHPALGQELTLSRATPSAVSDHLSELIGFPISKVLPYVLRLSCTEVPSLHRSSPASAVLRTSPPPQGAQPVPRGLPVGRCRPRHGASRVAYAFLVYMLSPLPRRSGWAYSSLCSPSRISLPRKGCRVGLRIVLFEDCSAFTRVTACNLALSPIRDTLIEGFSHFVTSMTAPIASGWSGCRVGFAPTGKRRLVTAHPRSGHPFSATAIPFARVRSNQGPQCTIDLIKKFIGLENTRCLPS